MKISFIKISPTQNVTVLVTTPVPRAQQPSVAAELLAYDGVGGEQVGFLEPPTLDGALCRLQMMGGEFCGNATMSVAAYIAWKEGLADGGSFNYPLEVSGAQELVVCRIERTGDVFRGTVSMPLPERISEITLDTDAGPQTFPMVVMPGITHLISASGMCRSEIERRIRSWNASIRADALGVLSFDEASRSIEPLVYVPSTNSVVWERGCGSGSAALGSWKASVEGGFSGAVRQPGGEIIVNAHDEFLTITGCVRIVAEGTAYI